MTEKPQKLRYLSAKHSAKNVSNLKPKSHNFESLAHKQKNSLFSLFKQGEYDEVFQKCKKLVKRFPNDLEILNLLGIAAAQTSNLYQAQKAFQNIIKLDSKNSQAYNNLGNILRQKSDPSCIKAYQKAIKLNPDFAEAHNNLGVAFLTNGENVEAIKSFRLATEINSNFHDAFYNLGTTLRQTNDFIESERAFLSAIMTAPDSSESFNGLGLTLYSQGKLHDALKKFEKALDIKPSNAEAHCNKGITLYALGHTTAAKDAYFNALSVDENNFQAATRLMAMDFGTLDILEIERCKSILRKRQRDDKNAAYMFFEANIEKHTGNYSKAFEYFKIANSIKKQQMKQSYLASERDYHTAKTRIENWRPAHQDPNPSNITTIFILGPSRSGKSTLEKLLMQTPKLVPIFESIMIDKFQTMPAQQVTFDGLFYYRESELLKHGTRFVTSTSPSTLFQIDLILDALRSSFCIFVDRDPLDLGAEIFQKNYKNGNSYAYDPQQIQEFLKLYSDLSNIVTAKVPDRCLRVSFNDLFNNTHALLRELQKTISPELTFKNTKVNAVDTDSQFRGLYENLVKQNVVF